MSRAPKHSGLKTLELRLQEHTPTRRVSVLFGVSPEVKYGVFNSNFNNCERAILERLYYIKRDGVFMSPPIPVREEFFNRLEEQTNHFSKLVQYTPRMTAEQFCGSYAGRRRTVYENAHKSLQINPLEIKDSYISFFIKCEKVNFTEKDDPVPRGISPRSPRYHVELGRYIKPIEKKLYTKIAEMYGARTVFKGLNAHARAKFLRSHWEYFDEPIAIGLDASRFDQHISKTALEWEHSIYMMYFRGDKHLRKLLQWQLVNKGYCRVVDGTMKFTLDGRRMSGDMNTALGNCLIMSSLIHSYVSSYTRKFRLANDGDDCVLIVEKRDYNAIIAGLSDWFLEMGFTMKVEDPVSEFEKIIFCQSQPVCVNGTWLMVRNPYTALAKDCLSIKPLDSESLFKRWIAAVGEGGLSLAGQVPIWQEFYKQLYDSAEGAKPLKGDPSQDTGLNILCKGMRQTHGVIQDSTRLSFYVAFGIEPARQRAIENYFKQHQLTFTEQNNFGRAAMLPW